MRLEPFSVDEDGLGDQAITGRISLFSMALQILHIIPILPYLHRARCGSNAEFPDVSLMS